MNKLRVLDLFSGIGGFSLGLERTGGFETVAFCEIEEFPRRVLAKHWPNVPCYRDVRELNADVLCRDGIAVDVICGGFPCQDISLAGLGEGLDGARSGLWSEIARLAGELRPKFLIVENVAALLSRGMDRVLGDLAALGFDAEWHCIPASAVGAPHQRDRVWIIANPIGDEQPRQEPRIGPLGRMGRVQQSLAWDRDWQDAFTEFRRMDDGLPRSVASTDGYRNAVVPQIPELIGRAILDSLNEFHPSQPGASSSHAPAADPPAVPAGVETGGRVSSLSLPPVTELPPQGNAPGDREVSVRSTSPSSGDFLATGDVNTARKNNEASK